MFWIQTKSLKKVEKIHENIGRSKDCFGEFKMNEKNTYYVFYE